MSAGRADPPAPHVPAAVPGACWRSCSVLQAIQAILNLLPAEPERRHHRQGRADREHPLHLAAWAAPCSIVALVQAVFAVFAVYFGARVAMGFGRDVRDALFHRSTALSAREVDVLGAPSLITRITNDVQQVQMLVVMACTMALAAPVTIVGGVILALRQDVGLDLAPRRQHARPRHLPRHRHRAMVPQFRLMQERIDRINRVLREQITGSGWSGPSCGSRRSGAASTQVNDELTETSLAAGRLMALMFPIVMLVINCSNVAVVWFGANRIAHGQMTIGSLIAFLTYFTLILMSVMMSTFVGVMAPRAAVCAERIQEVLDTEPSVVPPVEPGHA